MFNYIFLLQNLLCILFCLLPVCISPSEQWEAGSQASVLSSEESSLNLCIVHFFVLVNIAIQQIG